VALRAIRRICFAHLGQGPSSSSLVRKKAAGTFRGGLPPTWISTSAPTSLLKARQIPMLPCASTGRVRRRHRLLDGPGCAELLHYFTRSGMSINRNLFHLWNVHSERQYGKAPSLTAPALLAGDMRIIAINQYSNTIEPILL